MKLTTYFRSTAAYRVRIALNWKEVDHQLIAVDLFGGEQKEPSFLNHNPEGLVPTLEFDGDVFSQSMAILEYLEEMVPQPSLLPSDTKAKMRARGLAQSIVSDIHPLNNLRVLKYLVEELGQSETAKLKWYHHWLEAGFSGIEKRLDESGSNGRFCLGDAPTFADVCLVPQVYNANRFEFSLEKYPLIKSINEHCLSLSAFDNARPEKQADFNG